MTVCVAAITGNGTIFTASDRMITAGDIEFEPEQSKIWQLTTSICAMVAGDISLQSEIYGPVMATIRQRIEQKPEQWLTISEVATLWAQNYAKIRLRRSEQAILAPLGLTHDTFVVHNRDLAPDLATKIAQELMNFGMPDIGTIIAGLDSEGSHIYVVDIVHYD